MDETAMPAMPAGPDGPDQLGRALEVFVRGFAFTKSLTYPYVTERIGPAWVMRDAPRRDERKYRREEWSSTGVEPGELDRLARQHTRGRFALCPVRAMAEPDGPPREAYRGLGYRLGGTEALMIHRLDRVPRASAPAGVRIERVLSQPMVDRLAKAAGRRQLLPEHLAAAAPLRQYVAVEGDDPVGWVQSIVVPDVSDPRGSAAAADLTWCSNMFVLPSHRRRGIARAMLARTLRDDRRYGAAASVLLASHAGAKLYPVVGYEQLGELSIFTPRRS